MIRQFEGQQFRCVAAFALAFLAVAVAGSYCYPARATVTVRASTVMSSSGTLISSPALAAEALKGAALQSRISELIAGEQGVPVVPFQLSAQAETGMLQIQVTAGSMETATRVADVAAEAVVGVANRGELSADWAEIDRLRVAEQDTLGEYTRLSEQATVKTKNPHAKWHLGAALDDCVSRLTALRRRLRELGAELAVDGPGNAAIVDRARPEPAGKRWPLLAVSLVAGLFAAGVTLVRKP